MTEHPGRSGPPGWQGAGAPGQPPPPGGGQGAQPRWPHDPRPDIPGPQGPSGLSRPHGPAEQQAAPWPSGEPAPPGAGKGFFGALLDLNFNYLVTPKIIKLFYALALLVVTLSALTVLAVGLWVFQLRNGWLVGLLVMGSAPFIWILGALLVRIFMEAVVVRFKSTEYLRIIKDKP